MTTGYEAFSQRRQDAPSPDINSGTTHLTDEQTALLLGAPSIVSAERDLDLDQSTGRSSFLTRLERLLFEDNRNQIAWSEDHRAIVRVPAKILGWCARFVFLLGAYSALNLLVFSVPFALIATKTNQNIVLRSCLNYVALVSLPGIFRYGSELLPTAIPVGTRQTALTAKILLNAFLKSFSLDLEIAVIALVQRQITTVQAYIVGKIVATTLLNLGICQFIAGLRREYEAFNLFTAWMRTSLLFTAIAPLAMFSIYPSTEIDLLLSVSRAASIVLIVLYVVYLAFKHTHTQRYEVAEIDSAESESDTHRDIRLRSPGGLAAAAMVILPPLVTYLIAVPLLQDVHKAPMEKAVSPLFAGFCLLPLLAETAELPPMVRHACHSQMETILEASAGVGVQMALFIAPGLVILAWMLHVPLTLQFQLFEVVSLFVSVWVFGFLVSGGKSSWLTGAQSLTIYIILCFAAYLHFGPA